MERISIYLHGDDAELKPLLESRAEHSNRSLSAEVVALVKKGLRMDEAPYVYEIEVDGVERRPGT